MIGKTPGEEPRTLETKKIRLDLTANEIYQLQQILSKAKSEAVGSKQVLNAPGSESGDANTILHSAMHNKDISLIEKIERVLN